MIGVYEGDCVMRIIIVVMATLFRSFVRLFLKNDIPPIFEMLIGVFENPSLHMRGLKREFERKYVSYNDYERHLLQ